MFSKQVLERGREEITPKLPPNLPDDISMPLREVLQSKIVKCEITGGHVKVVRQCAKHPPACWSPAILKQGEIARTDAESASQSRLREVSLFPETDQNAAHAASSSQSPRRGSSATPAEA